MIEFVRRLFPGREEINPVDLTDAHEKLHRDKEDMRVVLERTERLERVWMSDELFPRYTDGRSRKGRR